MYPAVQIILAGMSIVSSVILGVITWLAFRYDKKIKKSAVNAALTQQCNIINNGIGQYGIGGPYTTLIGIPKTEYAEFGYYAVVLFHQLNLLDMVYKNGAAPNSNLLSKTEVAGYKSWTKTVLLPWVNSNVYLRQLLDKVLVQEDIFGKGFLDWLRELIK